MEHIGYPSELMDVRKLEELYEGLDLNNTHYLGNALNMTVFGTNYAFSKLREKVSVKAGCPKNCGFLKGATLMRIPTGLQFLRKVGHVV